MINRLTPEYLSEFIPPYVHEVSRYGLRDSNNLYKPKIRKGYVLKSFLWTSVDEWNNLDPQIRYILTLNQFKTEMKKHLFCKRNDLLNFGNGKGATNHARIRMGLSGLNAHRKKYNFIAFNDCPLCGIKPENEDHFFLKCADLVIHRTVLMGTITPLTNSLPSITIPPVTKLQRKNLLELLINGSYLLSSDQNEVLFSAVHEFITKSNRF